MNMIFVFSDQADDDRTRLVNVRALRDVVYHLLEAGGGNEALALVQDLIFVELRSRAGQLHDLLNDLDRVAAAKLPAAGRGHEASVANYRATLASLRVLITDNLHVLHASPVLFLPQTATGPNGPPRDQAHMFCFVFFFFAKLPPSTLARPPLHQTDHGLRVPLPTVPF